MSREVQLEFRVLGPLEARAGDRLLPLGGKKQRALLALLLLHADEVVSIDRLVDGLWGERPPSTAVHTVRVFVSELRKALQSAGVEQPLVTRAPGYALALEPDQLDLSRFTRVLGEARHALAEDDYERAADELREALALWRGPPLADLTYEPFAQDEIARLEELRLTALEERIEADLALGRHGEVVAELETLVRAHPLRERLRTQLMLALYRSGRQVEALAAFREARRLLVEELGLEPSHSLRELEARILRQDDTLAPPDRRSGPRTNLPAPATFLVGRARELAETAAMLRRPEVRLFSLTGPAGTGKTRLGLALAELVAGDFRDGVFLVELAPLREAGMVVPTIAHTLGVREARGEPVAETLKRHLREKELLLVLDNFEHVLVAAPSVAELLAAAPRLKTLVTSRARLRLSGEHDYPVPPLAEPEAVALFAERAREVQPSFELSETDRHAVGEICERLDGLPLAIELAAARTKLLAPEALLARLARPLELLTGGAVDLPERHQTLRAAIDWSYRLLEPREQTVFARLGVFVGGAALESAEEVCETDLDALSSLADKSLVRREIANGASRLDMLETIREYALERLDASADGEALRRRHAQHYLALAEQAEPELEGVRQALWLARLDREHDNLRAALSWSNRGGAGALGLRLAAALSRFWAVRGYLSEGRKWLDEALTSSGERETALRAKALRGTSYLAYWQGDHKDWEASSREAFVLFSGLGDRREVARSLRDLGNLAAYEGDHEQARRLYQESATLSREVGDDWNVAAATANLGSLALEQREYERAAALCEQALALSRDPFNVAVALGNLGVALAQQDRHREAQLLFEESLRLGEELGFKDNIAYCLEGLAAVVAARGEAERSARLLAAAEALWAAIGGRLFPSLADMHARTLAAVRDQLGEVRLAALWAEGQAMRPDEAIDSAVDAERMLSAR